MNAIAVTHYLMSFSIVKSRASQVALVVKNLPVNTGAMRCGFDLWVGTIPWRRAWKPFTIFLRGESHG